MADEKKGIFDLADKFDYQSPFDDWLEGDSNSGSPQPRINVVKIQKLYEYRNTNPQWNTIDEYVLIISVMGSPYKVTVEHNGKEFLAEYNDNRYYSGNYLLKLSTFPELISQPKKFEKKDFAFSVKVFPYPNNLTTPPVINKNKGYSLKPSDLKIVKVNLLQNGSAKLELYKNNGIEVTTFYIYWNTESQGRIEKHIPIKIKDGFKNRYRYVYVNKNDEEHEICTVVVYKNIQSWILGSYKDMSSVSEWEVREIGGKTRSYKKGKGKTELIKVPVPIDYKKGNIILKLTDNTDREYMNPIAFASLLGALAECSYEDFQFNGSTSKDGTGAPSVTHYNGIAFDMRYLRKDKKIEGLHINTNPEKLDITRQEKFIDALIKFGYQGFYSFNITIDDSPFILKNSEHMALHHHHIHAKRENYSPNFEEIEH